MCTCVRSMVIFAKHMCNNAQVNWDELRIVLAISRERTLSQAARSLGVTHTTIGRRVRALEQSLGVRLFDRSPDGFTPTPAGQDIAEVAARMEGEVHALEGRVLGRDAELRGELRVATMDILFRRYHPAFSSFIARYPSVDLTLNSSDREVSLIRREADVVLRMTNTPPPYLVGRKVGRVEFAVYASEALVERVGADAGYEDYPWLNWDARSNMRWLDAWLAHRAPNAKTAMRVDVSSLVMREAVAAGIGVHFLASFEGDADPSLVRLGPVEHEFSRDLWLLTLPDLRSTQRVRAFMDHVSEELCAQPGKDSQAPSRSRL